MLHHSNFLFTVIKALAACSLFLVLLWLMSGCTSVTAELEDGTKINVVTFAQSRQDIDIGRDKDGVHWKASNSSPDQTLTKAIADLVGIIAAAPKP